MSNWKPAKKSNLATRLREIREAMDKALATAQEYDREKLSSLREAAKLMRQK